MAERVVQDRKLDPLLMLPDGTGTHFLEHIPRNNSRFRSWILTSLVILRIKLDLPIYFWQLRHLFLPKDRKIYDLHFIRHVEQDHDGKPVLWMERIHYFFAQVYYAAEIGLVQRIEDSIWHKDGIKDVYFQRDPYIKAYKKKWIESFKEAPEWKLLFHGATVSEIRMVIDRLEQLRVDRGKLIDLLESANKLKKI